MDSGKAVLIGDASITDPIAASQASSNSPFGRFCAHPWWRARKAFALIYLENREVTNRFTEEQRDLLDEVCTLAAPRLRAAVTMSQAQRRAEALEHAHSRSDGS